MSLPRLLLSIVLILTLAGAPALRVMAMSAPQAGDARAHHAMHSAGGDAFVSFTNAEHSSSACGQHEFCNGQCCATCAQSFTAVSLRLLASDLQHTVLTPIVPRLLFSLFISQRERPPRLLSV